MFVQPAPAVAAQRSAASLFEQRRSLVCGHRRVRSVRQPSRVFEPELAASAETQTPAQSTSFKDAALAALVKGVLNIEPLASLLKKQARKTITKRAEKMGLDWTRRVEELKAEDLEGYMARVENKGLKIPEYYKVDFHTYPSGNLSWEAATEIEVSSVAVHASIYPDLPMEEGDKALRGSYSAKLRELVPGEPARVLDVGCSTGLSTLELEELYPGAAVTGIDLSPYFLAVARLRADQRGSKTEFVHAAAEATGLADGSVDLASICLVTHELPQAPTRQMLREMHRVVRPGGYLAMMDQDPHSEVFRRMAPALKTLFRSTEPYLEEYQALDMPQALREAGFEAVTVASNSPRHRTIVARKPL
eukprot:tig00021127_g18690.t1